MTSFHPTIASPFSLISIYLRPSLGTYILDPLSTDRDTRETLHQATVAIDTNARNRIWGSKRTDSRGDEIENRLDHLQLTLANLTLESLAYVPSATNFLDITLHGELVTSRRWRYLDTPSLSDHSFVAFKFSMQDNEPDARSRHSCVTLPGIDRIEAQPFQEALQTRLTNRPPPSTLHSPAAIDHATLSLSKCIHQAARETIRPRVRRVRPTSAPWWSAELANLRQNLRKSHRKR